MLPALLVALTSATPLAAVPVAPATAPTATPSEREVVVMVEDRSFAAWHDLSLLAARFEEEHPGVRVRLADQSGAAGSQDKIKFLIAGDLPLDVARIDITELSAFVAENALFDVRPVFEELGFDTAGYFPGPVDSLRGPNGELYGMPSTFTPYVMYYNADLLASLGMEPPREGWTWDDLLAAARAATRDLDGDGRSDQYGLSLTQWLQAVVPWVWQNGGRLLDESTGLSGMAEPEFVGAMQFLHDLLHVERVASFDASFQNQLSQGLFQAGRVAFYGPVGYWETYRFKEIEDFEWDVVPLPRGKREATAIAMTIFVVPRTAREPELGAEFVTWLAGEEYQRALARIGNGVPALRSAAESEDFLKPDVPPESEEVFFEVLENARFMPPLANWRKIESLCQAELEGILLEEGIDVPAACARMAEKTDRFLQRERERPERTRVPVWAMELALTVSFLALIGGFLARRGKRPHPLVARQERAGYSMITLWAVGFGLFLFGPGVVTLLLSLCEWSPLRELTDVRWIGLENYARLTSDGTFHTSLGVTAAYAAFAVPLGLALALALALLWVGESTLCSVLRTICYLPAIISPVIVAAVWRSIFDAEGGLLNEALGVIGIDGPAWLRSSTWVLPSFVVMSLWSVGAQMLIFIAALKAIDPTLLEAARIDGAGAWRRFRHVTLPALSPVVLFNLLTGLIFMAQVFAQPYIMTQGGPGDSSRFLVLYLYESGFKHLDMGYASAIAWVLFLLLSVLCLVLLRTSHKWVHYAGKES